VICIRASAITRHRPCKAHRARSARWCASHRGEVVRRFLAGASMVELAVSERVETRHVEDAVRQALARKP
jgi:hypothetical protein